MLSEFVKSADWKSEKHMPVIDLTVKICVGKEIPHPNTAQHHISWMALHYVPEGSKVSIELARCEFSAHGGSMDPATPGPAFTQSAIAVTVKLDKPGKLFATSYCNLHGLWSSEMDLA